MLRTLTYTSRVRQELGEGDLERIVHAARTLNALDGVTGLLVFNGWYFLQIVEGTDDAIGDLLRRLTSDPRHHDIVVREDRAVDSRSFPDWSMALTRVSRGRFEARRDIAQALPATVSDEVRAMVVDMADLISS